MQIMLAVDAEQQQELEATIKELEQENRWDLQKIKQFFRKKKKENFQGEWAKFVANRYFVE